MHFDCIRPFISYVTRQLIELTAASMRQPSTFELNKAVVGYSHEQGLCRRLVGAPFLLPLLSVRRRLGDMRGGLKRWVTETITIYRRCKDCGATSYCNSNIYSQRRYGPQLSAFIVYNIIQLHISQYKLSDVIQNLFGLPLSQQTINRIKRRAAEYYACTLSSIKRKLTSGGLIHADETQVGIKGKSSYVWTFTSMEEVIYLWTEARDGIAAHEFLQPFNGVLVSDFYSVYDSVACAQQKCLIHLIRDLNESVLKEPFNEELRQLAQDFGHLLRPIVAEIDRVGLKKRFLRKYQTAVIEFFKVTSGRAYKTDQAKKLQKRLGRNSTKLFTFLEHDNVPWNNNNAEHAIKSFARLRDIIDCHSNEAGIRDYLVLLSISQTCEYRGIDFLTFLRSGETDLEAYTTSSKGKRSTCISHIAPGD